MNDKLYQICINCVMDTSDPDILFDQQGICNYCNVYEERKKSIVFQGAKGEEKLNVILSQLKKRNGKYDCIIGLSGGIDSSYLAYWFVRVAKLKVLAVHVDGGWNSEIAINNIEKIVKALDIDLNTYVLDWTTMRNLQIAFLKSGVSNQDVPQDHAFVAALYKVACENNIKTVLNGYNFVSESILPIGWGHSAMDFDQIKDINRKFGMCDIKDFPKAAFWKYYIYYPYIKGVKVLSPLNYIDYNPHKAIEVLRKEFGWTYYGGKHHESRFTKFFQSYWLPERFGFDKRRAHLSSLILAGVISRDSALKQLGEKSYNSSSIEVDKFFIAKKLDISVSDLDDLMKIPIKHFWDYRNDRTKIKVTKFISRMLCVKR